jgi:quinol monooxygenase YgiN
MRTGNRYKDKDSADAHTQTEHFKQLIKDFEDEGILAEPPWLSQTVSKGGFDLDRKLQSK